MNQYFCRHQRLLAVLHCLAVVLLFSIITLSVNHLPLINLDRLDALPHEPNYGRTSSVHWFRITPFNSRSDNILGVVYMSPATKNSRSAITQVQTNILTTAELQ